MTSPLVIDLDSLVTNANAIPFKNVLQPPAARSGRPTKTLKATQCYVFEATFGGVGYYKVGETSDLSTYHSRNRFIPPDPKNPMEYVGVVQIQTYGKLFEALIKAYFAPSVSGDRKCEWFRADAVRSRVSALGDALALSPAFKTEKPFSYSNIKPFSRAYTAAADKTIDDLLSLFGVRWRSGVYSLTETNVELPVRLMTLPKYSVSSSPTSTTATDKRALTASAVIDDDEEEEDEENEEEETSSEDE